MWVLTEGEQKLWNGSLWSESQSNWTARLDSPEGPKTQVKQMKGEVGFAQLAILRCFGAEKRVDRVMEMNGRRRERDGALGWWSLDGGVHGFKEERIWGLNGFERKGSLTGLWSWSVGWIDDWRSECWPILLLFFSTRDTLTIRGTY